ncbi:MAG: DUF3850 domain-containing protein [bacterium]|nr:DUF3850 domain-containing protein [bacterium]
MAEIRKKMWLAEFEAVLAGKKKIDIRVADFEVKDGDTLVLEEWNPDTKQYTGRSIGSKVVHVMKFKIDDYGQQQEIQNKGLYAIQLE